MDIRGLEIYGFGFAGNEEAHIRMHMRFVEQLSEASLTAQFRLWPASGCEDPVVVLTHIDPLALLEAEDAFGRLPAIGDVNGILKFPIRIIPVPWENKNEVLAMLCEQDPTRTSFERAA